MAGPLETRGAVAALQTNGTLWAWGSNTYGQLGLGDTAPPRRSSPTQVGTLATWSSVFSTTAYSSPHSFAVRTDGTMWTWGYNKFGQLGMGDTVYRSSPTQVGTLAAWTGGSKNAGFGNTFGLLSG